MDQDRKPLGLNTRTIHAGAHPDPATGAVAPPIYQTSTFAFADCHQGAARFAGDEDGYIYTRMGNPTIARLEEAVAELEGGAGGLATSSVYGPSRVVMERDFARFGVASDFVDTSDLDAVRAALRPETRLVFVETPANPTVDLADIAAIADIAHDH